MYMSIWCMSMQWAIPSGPPLYVHEYISSRLVWIPIVYMWASDELSQQILHYSYINILRADSSGSALFCYIMSSCCKCACKFRKRKLDSAFAVIVYPFIFNHCSATTLQRARQPNDFRYGNQTNMDMDVAECYGSWRRGRLIRTQHNKTRRFVMVMLLFHNNS